MKELNLEELINHRHSEIPLTKGESWLRGKQRQWRALNNGCLLRLFVGTKAGDFSCELQTGAFPVHQRQTQTPTGHSTHAESQSGLNNVFYSIFTFPPLFFPTIFSLHALCLEVNEYYSVACMKRFTLELAGKLICKCLSWWLRYNMQFKGGVCVTNACAVNCLSQLCVQWTFLYKPTCLVFASRVTAQLVSAHRCGCNSN